MGQRGGFKNNPEKAREAAKKRKSQKGIPKRKTIFRIALGLDTKEKSAALREKIDELTTKFLNSRGDAQFIAWKEILKYTYPQKKTLDVTSGGETIQNNVFIIPAFNNSDDVNTDSSISSSEQQGS